jgi:hypothetical protein
MAYLLGAFVGGFLLSTLVGLLIGLAFKRKEPSERAIIAAMGGWIGCAILAGFGMADGGPFRFDAGLSYIPGAIAAFFYLRWHYGKMWNPDEEEVQLTD